MKKLLIILIIILAIILIFLVSGGIYAYLILKPFLISTTSTNTNELINTDSQTVIDKHPFLTPIQEATLEKIGIDPAKLPTTITPAMEACFIEKLGTDRVKAIKDGESPNPIDFLKAKSCLTN